MVSQSVTGHCENQMTTTTKMSQLRRMNALTYEQARIMTKLANNEPLTPKSLAVLNKFF